MRIPRIEPARVRAQVRRMDAQAWVRQVVGTHDQRMVLFEQNGPLKQRFVSGEAYSLVVLSWNLNWAPDVEAKRQMVSDAIDSLVPGGLLVAIARACDSGEELALRMVGDGCPPDQLGLSNLTNNEIACLRPQTAVLLTGTASYRADSEDLAHGKLRDFAELVRKSPVPPDDRLRLPSRFVTRLVDVGMTWQKPKKT